MGRVGRIHVRVINMWFCVGWLNLVWLYVFCHNPCTFQCKSITIGMKEVAKTMPFLVGFFRVWNSRPDVIICLHVCVAI